MKFIGNYQNLLIKRCLWFCSCGIFMRAFQTSSLSLSPLTQGPWVMRNSVSVTSRRWIEKLKVLYIFSSEKWPNPQSCLDELLQSFPPWFPIANHKNTLLKSKNDLICNFFALKYVTLASLRIIMWVLWEFCLRWSGNLFSLMTTITTSKISNVLKLHTLQVLFFLSFIRLIFRGISSLPMMDMFQALSWLNNTKVSSSFFYRKALFFYKLFFSSQKWWQLSKSPKQN